MPGTGILAGTDLLMSVKETAAAWQGSMTWCHQPEQYKPQTPVDYAGGVKQQHTCRLGIRRLHGIIAVLLPCAQSQIWYYY